MVGQAVKDPFVYHVKKDARTILTELYTKHNPAKLASIDKILKKYKGNIKSVIESIRDKYEKKPTGKVTATPKKSPAKASDAPKTPETKKPEPETETETKKPEPEKVADEPKPSKPTVPA